MIMKNNKGITLVSLVITIIVLLILAGVTISMLLGDGGIIAQAQEAKEANEKGIGRDEGVISAAEGILSQYIMEKYANVKDDAGYAKQNSTINGEKASNSNPVIPKGFKAVNGDDTNKITSNWNGTNFEDEIKKGLVIEDAAGNQFVWVPVNGTTVKLELDSAFGTKGREPDLVTGKTTSNEDGKIVADLVDGTTRDAVDTNRKAILDDGYDNTTEGLKEQFTDEYNAMVKSVKAYGGFYVGRYETGWDEEKGVVVSKPGTPMTAATALKGEWTKVGSSNNNNQATWYGLYAKQKELYKKNSSSSVVSGMIYGCQWDAIMNWMLQGTPEEQKFVTDSSDKGHYGASKATTTGTEGYDVKNIYDLAGNYSEWTQEAYTTDNRVRRGNYYGSNASSGSASKRHTSPPTGVYSNYSSRLQLYIK